MQAALEAGITTFDTADGYANTVAEKVLGDALKGENRDGLEIFTKVYFPTGAKGHNDTGLSRKHIMASIDGSLERLQTDHVDLYQAHRYDYETPLEETMQAFADVVRQGKALYIGVSEWTPEQLREAHGLSRELGFQLISNQPQYSALWRVIEEEVVPTSKDLGISQIVWSPIAQGVLTGKYKPGQDLPQGSRATDDKGGADMIKRYMNDDTLTRVQELQPVADELDLSLAQLAGVGAAERQRRIRDHRRLAARAGPRERQGVGREDPGRAPHPRRRRPRRRRGEGPVEDERQLAEGAPRLTSDHLNEGDGPVRADARAGPSSSPRRCAGGKRKRPG